MSIAGITETSQYLTFTLAEEVFSLEVSKVREILEHTSVAKVPRTPDFMMGVINLRGNVVPVMDLRLKFGLPQTERTVNTCIIVVEVDCEGEQVIVGTLADSVREVVEIDPVDIEAAPAIGTRLDTSFIKGMGKQDGGFVMILDIDRVFSGRELAESTAPAA